MAYNVSYFLETIPETFDVWNATAKITYFVTYLQGFLNLPEDIQTWLVEDVTYEQMETFHADFSNATWQQNVESDSGLTWNNDTGDVLDFMYK